jgi:hypothetical protein
LLGKLLFLCESHKSQSLTIPKFPKSSHKNFWLPKISRFVYSSARSPWEKPKPISKQASCLDMAELEPAELSKSCPNLNLETDDYPAVEAQRASTSEVSTETYAKSSEMEKVDTQASTTRPTRPKLPEKANSYFEERNDHPGTGGGCHSYIGIWLRIRDRIIMTHRIGRLG